MPQAIDPTNLRGSPQKDYDTSRPGDSWFSQEGNDMDNRKDTRGVDESGRARKMQAQDSSKRMADMASSLTAKADAKRKAASKTGAKRMSK